MGNTFTNHLSLWITFVDCQFCLVYVYFSVLVLDPLSARIQSGKQIHYKDLEGS